MSLIKKQWDKPKNEKNKIPGNPNWGGAREESKLIEKYADQWCKDNGYPLIKRKYVYRGKWKLVDIKRWSGYYFLLSW